MARARNIKPKFFQNDELGELPPLARLLFIGMWTIADFRGCLEFRPKRIKTQLLPYDECDIETLSNALDKSGFISIYSVQGQRYVKILKFDKHQTPHKNERDAGSEIPDISEKDKEINELKEDGNNPDKNGTTRAESLFLNPESFNLNPESLAGAGALAGSAAVVVAPQVERRKSPRASMEVQEVFDYWKQAMRHPSARLDDKRAKAIGQRLADGYTVGQLCQAVDGCRKSPYHMGQNDSNMVYDDIELICRNTSKVESFINRAGAASSGINPGLQSQIDTLQAWMEEE